MCNFIKPTIIELETINSTNTYAKQMLQKSEIIDGTVIWAKNQTQGKGQQGNKWESEPDKNLTFSIIVFPHFLPPENQFLLNKIIAISVQNLVNKETQLHNAVKIKWPNDIYINHKKVAGILIENTISGNIWNTCIIGIGININQENFSDKLPNPVSLKLATGKTFDIKTILEKFITIFSNYYEILKNHEFENISNQYLNLLYQYQELKKYKVKDNIVEAKITGISEFGRLKLTNINKDELECDFKEIIYL